MKPIPAALIATTTTFAAQLCGRRFSPTPDHPRTAAWYAKLRKPAFTPPGIVFGLVWCGLDTLFAWSGYRLLRAEKSPERACALTNWGLTLLGIAAFPWVAFKRKSESEALAVTGAITALTAVTATMSNRVDRKAALLTLPLLGWTLFASLLQEEIWRRNRS